MVNYSITVHDARHAFRTWARETGKLVKKKNSIEKFFSEPDEDESIGQL